MVITIACLGLRVCELIGLQWADIDFENLTVTIQRSVVEGEVNLTKNEASESTLPLDPELATVLLDHRRRVVCVAETDFLFVGDTGKPRWPDSILADHLKPAAVRAAIGKIGWHTFRHTYSKSSSFARHEASSPKRIAAPRRHSNYAQHLHAGGKF